VYCAMIPNEFEHKTLRLLRFEINGKYFLLFSDIVLAVTL
jgi:hypothetical protein